VCGSTAGVGHVLRRYRARRVVHVHDGVEDSLLREKTMLKLRSRKTAAIVGSSISEPVKTVECGTGDVVEV
jgi:hypothetical protein